MAILAWLSRMGIGTIATRLAGLAEAYVRAQSDTERAKISLEIERLKAQRDILIAEQGWKVTAWIRPLFAYPLIVWWAAVIADSIFTFDDWDVAALPAPLDDWAGAIVAAYFVSRPFEKVAQAYLARR